MHTSNDISIQSDAKGNLQHFLSVKDLTPKQIKNILSTAQSFINKHNQIQNTKFNFQNIIMANLFFEASTRTRISFEIAAFKLNAHVINFNPDISSVVKGESLLDTLQNLIAMGVDLFVIRHKEEFTPKNLAEQIQSKVCIINAGDGRNEHPTQAMLDLLTIARHKSDIAALRVAIVGDILHSRVANSLSWGLHHMGCADIRWVGPSVLLPTDVHIPGVTRHEELESGLEKADVIMVLRLQRERMSSALSLSTDDYFKQYGITSDAIKSAASDAIIMHPGPINRNVEIASEIADGEQSVILEQVTNGVAIRMAIIKTLLENKSS